MGKLKLWLWARFFMFLVCMGSAMHRQRMSHNNAVAGRGKVRFNDDLDIPDCDFFEPGKEFQCRIRHACIAYMDDAMLVVRGVSLKLADTEFKSPFDLQANTGRVCFFWNAKSFLQFAFNRKEKDGHEYVDYYRDVSMEGPRASYRRNPSSYTQLYFHGQTPYDFKAKDGKKRYVKYRIIPWDKGDESGLVDPELLETPEQCANQTILEGETRGRNYLKNEYRERVEGEGAKYHLQFQFHEAQDDDPPEIFSVMHPWDEETHPWIDVATIEIDEVLSHKDQVLTSFEISHLPSCMGILPAKDMEDYNSLNYFRIRSIWSIRIRRFFTKLLGPRKALPDEGPRNIRAPWT